MTILDALADANLFAPLFAASWAPWRAALAAIHGLPMDAVMRATYQRHTGRTTPPSAQAREAWLIVGRRGGKSRMAALLVTYAAAFRRYALAPGERGVAMVIAADRRQARVVFRYVCALFDAVPMLARLVAERTAEALRADQCKFARTTQPLNTSVHHAPMVLGHSLRSSVARWRRTLAQEAIRSRTAAAAAPPLRARRTDRRRRAA